MARHTSIFEISKRHRMYRHAIGDYVVSFGNLEADIDDAIVTLLGASDENRAKIAISQILNVSTRIRMLVVLVGLITQRRRQISKITKLAAELTKQNAFRNNLVHGSFDEFKTYRLPSKRIQHEWVKTKINPRSMKVTTFNATFSELKKNTRKIDGLGLRLRKAIHELILIVLKDLTRKPPPSSRARRAQRRLKRLLGQDHKAKAPQPQPRSSDE